MAAGPEDILTMQIARLLKATAPDLLWWHVPNGGTRRMGEARKFKDMGVRRGVPDLCFLLPGGQFAGIELKAPKGRMEPSQKQFQDHCNRLNAPYAVCRSWEEVEAFLRRLGVTFRHRSPE